MLKKLLCLSSFLTLSGCVTIPNTTACSVAGKLADGMTCATTETGETSALDFNGALTFLEPTTTRAGAICQSADDYAKLKTALQEACRSLGSKCTYEMQAAMGTGAESQ